MASVPGKRGNTPPVFSGVDFARKLTRSLLKRIYEKAASGEVVPTPDAALARMHEQIERLSGGTGAARESESFPAELARLDFRQLECEAHHYAVDLFYATLRPRKGAPPLRPEYLNQLLALRSEGLSPRKIAIRLGLGPSLESADRVRHQLRIAQGKSGKK